MLNLCVLAIILLTAHILNVILRLIKGSSLTEVSVLSVRHDTKFIASGRIEFFSSKTFIARSLQ